MEYFIWSNEYGAWWKPNSNGYTHVLALAGRYTKDEAVDILDNLSPSMNLFVEGIEATPVVAIQAVTL